MGRYTSADWYDRTHDWSSRLRRELPMLTGVLGPPGKGGVLDAGCGTGRHVCALRQRGYSVIGADISRGMLDVAERNAREASIEVRFVCTPLTFRPVSP